MQPTEYFFFLAPFVDCQKCERSMDLPYGDLPQTAPEKLSSSEGTCPLELPEDGWSVALGCCECGQVSIYQQCHVQIQCVQRLSERRYRDEANVFSVEFQCGNTNCKVPAKIYVDMSRREGLPIATELDVRQLLRSGYFVWILPCGHHMMPVPDKVYRIDRVVERLW
jgi:hypothetical protein